MGPTSMCPVDFSYRGNLVRWVEWTMRSPPVKGSEKTLAKMGIFPVSVQPDISQHHVPSRPAAYPQDSISQHSAATRDTRLGGA